LLYGDLFPDRDEDILIRCEESCRVELLDWGASLETKKNRPYFEGHERKDVVV